MDKQYITSDELDHKIQDLNHDLKQHIANLGTRFRDEIDTVRREIHDVEVSTKQDVQRVNDRLDNKLSGIDAKMSSNNELLTEIKTILKSKEKQYAEIRNEQDELNQKHNKQMVDIAVLNNQHKSLYEDIHGSVTKPDNLSLFALMREVNAKISDVLSMSALHGEEIQQIQSEIEYYKQGFYHIISYGRKLLTFMFSKAGIGAGIAAALALLALSEPKEVEHLIEILTNLFQP